PSGGQHCPAAGADACGGLGAAAAVAADWMALVSGNTVPSDRADTGRQPGPRRSLYLLPPGRDFRRAGLARTMVDAALAVVASFGRYRCRVEHRRRHSCLLATDCNLAELDHRNDPRG